jgi:hypothetical protein
LIIPLTFIMPLALFKIIHLLRKSSSPTHKRKFFQDLVLL